MSMSIMNKTALQMAVTKARRAAAADLARKNRSRETPHVPAFKIAKQPAYLTLGD